MPKVTESILEYYRGLIELGFGVYYTITVIGKPNIVLVII